MAFISLGLPDSLLGTGWPKMFHELNVPPHYAGIISMIIASGTVVSSLLSSKIIDRYGVVAVTTFSVLVTALALLGFSFSHNFLFLCLLALPLGLGAGSIDVALNNYVALHYEARHMNWLHCFWGVGAAISPMIMAYYLKQGLSWSNGYKTVGIIQLFLVVILLLSISLWAKQSANEQSGKTSLNISSFKLLSIPGLKQALIVFFCYCTIEATFGLWGASYLVFTKDFEPDKAARYVSLYYLGITIGRFISGFVTIKLSNKQMVYLGQSLILLGVIILLLHYSFTILAGFFLIGLGCAPIFPALLHETPRNFGEKYSQKIMGLQMACAYIGILIMPYLFGGIASVFSYSALLWFIGFVLAVQVVMTYDLNRKVLKQNQNIT